MRGSSGEPESGAERGPGRKAVEIKYLIRVLLGNWRFVVGVTLVATLCGLLATYLLPEKFQASTRILIRPKREANFAVSGKGMMDYPVPVSTTVENISKTFAEIMVSDGVLTKVVEKLRLHEPGPRPHESWFVRNWKGAKDWVRDGIFDLWDIAKYGVLEKKEPFWKAVDDIRAGMSAAPLTDTYIFTLTATAPQPQVATAIANTTAEMFVEYVRSARRSEDGTAAGLVSETLSVLRADILETQSQLAAFRHRTKATSLKDELKAKLDTRSRFEERLAEVEKDYRAKSAELIAIEARLAERTSEIHSGSTLERNPALESLEGKLAVNQVELAGLKETHTDSHPRVRSLQAEIEQSKARIAELQAQVRATDTTSLNQVYQTLDEKHLTAGAEKASLEAQGLALRDVIGRYDREIPELADNQAELDRLELQLSTLEDNYSQASREYQEARLATFQQISEIRVLHPATPPVYPVGPIKIYYAGAAFSMGLLTAVLLLLVREYMDRRIRTVEDLMDVIDLPVLGTVPHAVLSAGTGLLLDSGTARGDVYLARARWSESNESQNLPDSDE